MYSELAGGAVPPVLALDVEWCAPWFARPGLHKDKVAVLQLGSFGAGVLVFHVHLLPELPPTVARLLGDPDVALLGVNVAGDARRLMRSFAVRTKKGLRSPSPISHLPHTPPPSPPHLHPSVRCRRCAPARWERRSLRAPDGLRITVSNLRDLAQHQDKSGLGNGLTHLVKAHCPGVYHGEHLDKSGAEVRAIRTGDWGSWPLSPAALAYAALDVLMRWTC